MYKKIISLSLLLCMGVSNVSFASTPTKQLTIEQTNYTENEGLKVEDITYKDGSKKITIVGEFTTDIVEYNSIDDTYTLNNVEQCVVSEPVVGIISYNSNLFSNTDAIIWNYTGRRTFTFDLRNKTLIQGAALLALALGITVNDAKSTVTKFIIVTGMGTAALIATSTFYGTLKVTSDDYKRHDGVRLWHRTISRFYWNGRQFTYTDKIYADAMWI